MGGGIGHSVAVSAIDGVENGVQFAPPSRQRDVLGYNNVFGGRAGAMFRSAIALRFLPQDSLEAALETIQRACVRFGLLDGLCVIGLGGDENAVRITAGTLEDLVEPSRRGDAWRLKSVGPAQEQGVGPRLAKQASAETKHDDGCDLVKTYVTCSGDVQSAALLFCHAAHLDRPPDKLKYFFALYTTLLFRWQLHRQRAGLHSLLLARLPQDDTAQNRSAVLFCYFCNGPLTGQL